MAFSTTQISIFFTLFLFSSPLLSHARDGQFFNKVPTSTNNNDQQPEFIPENDNTYGLYGHESGQLPPSTTTADLPNKKYLPKNYNPVAYVTVPEGTNDNEAPTEEKTYSTNPTTTGGDNSYYNSQQLEETENPYNYNGGSSFNSNTRLGGEKYSDNYNGGGSSFNSNPQRLTDTRLGGETYSENYNGGSNFNSNTRLDGEKYSDNYNGGGSSFNSNPQRLTDTRLGGETYTDNYNGGSSFNSNTRLGGEKYSEPQGLSDTRSYRDGIYHYDVIRGKYNPNHPYGAFSSTNQFNKNGYDQLNAEDSFQYQNQEDQFQEDDNNLP